MIKYAVKYLKNTFVPLNVSDNIVLADGQYIIAHTEKGEEVLKVCIVSPEISACWDKANPKPQAFDFVKIMTKQDLDAWEEIKKEEVTSFFKCKALIEKLKLSMNLVQCKITFDKRKITFYYTAPERVDFRELLKELTQVFKRVRIDLRHIGVRDETSIMEGVGICGHEFCCCSFKRKFEPINVKLARDQGMPITPSKISGTCGRLLCCLNYEYSTYIEAAKGMPPIGCTVMTPNGLGKVCLIKFLNGVVSVKLEDGKTYDFNRDEIEMVDADVNVDIDIHHNPMAQAYPVDEKVDMRQLKQLEDDRNSSTGNV